MGLIPNKVFNFATTPRPALRPTQPPFQELVENCCLRMFLILMSVNYGPTSFILIKSAIYVDSDHISKETLGF